jgi:Superinfection immunity protein
MSTEPPDFARDERLSEQKFRARGMAEPTDRIDDNTPSQKSAGRLTTFVLAAAALAIIIRAVIAAPDSVLPFVFVSVFVTIYFLPSIIAVDRNHRQRIPIMILNVLLGWAFHGWWIVLGWIIALVWACTAAAARKRREPA